MSLCPECGIHRDSGGVCQCVGVLLARIAELEARVAGLQTLEQHVRARSAEFAIRSVREIGKRDQRIAELEEKGNEWEARSVRLATRCCEAEARVRELEAQLAEGAEIILALTGREPVVSADGKIIGFVEAEVKP